MVDWRACACSTDQRAGGGHPEDATGEVLVGVIGVGALVALGLELRAGLLESIGDVLEEDEPEHDVLVLAGVHAAA